MDLRRTFDEDAELYDRARPGYPAAMFDALFALADREPAGCRVLELGAGTGKATAALVARGCRVTALDLGPNMAKVLTAKLPTVEVVVGAFEEWPRPAEPYDLVFSATAWHWFDPEVRTERVADALRPGGALAVAETHHIAGGTGQFFADAHDCELRFDPATEPGILLQPAREIPADAGEVAQSPRFDPVEFRRFEWDATYPTRGYLDLLRTYSGNRALAPSNRDGLLRCIGDLIDRRYGGRITKRYLTQLWVARRA